MRWREKKEPEKGDKRTIERFLLLPRTIVGETRWLEWAKIEQEYKVYTYSTLIDDLQWRDVAWGN